MGKPKSSAERREFREKPFNQSENNRKLIKKVKRDHQKPKARAADEIDNVLAKYKELDKILECLWRNRWTQADGLGALVIVPTRELAYQIFEVLNKVGENHQLSAALLIGGTEVEFQLRRLFAMNIIICTPGRLLQHLEENSNFQVDQLQMLVIDEADRILDLGFRKQVGSFSFFSSILPLLPDGRHPRLSADRTADAPLFGHSDAPRGRPRSGVRFVARVRRRARARGQDDARQAAAGGQGGDESHSLFVCRATWCVKKRKKINFLWSFLVNHKYKKTLIFVTCCRQARFLTEALRHLRPGLSLSGLWGTQKQHKRLETFESFDQNKRGAAMIATDIASRGLDFRNLDWVLQLDCPADRRGLHPPVGLSVAKSDRKSGFRVGRTARMDKDGEAVLVLTPSQEKPFVKMLKQRHIPIECIAPDEKRIRDIRPKLMSTLSSWPELKEFAQRSIVDYARALYFSKLKSVFDVSTVNFSALAESCGLATAPRIRFLKKRGIDGKKEADDDQTKKERDQRQGRREASHPPVPRGGQGREERGRRGDGRDPHRGARGPEELPPVGGKKTLTKQQAIKRMLKKKNIVYNNKIVFDEEDDQKEALAPTTDTADFDIEEAKRELEAENEADKKRHRELMRKLKREKRMKHKPKADLDDDELDLGGSDGEMQWRLPSGYEADEDERMDVEEDASDRDSAGSSEEEDD
ncbi:RNA helicase [Aphelenchoides fujianensis]|nr:RNA helicase [Aphelenchoides fujianensis]